MNSFLGTRKSSVLWVLTHLRIYELQLLLPNFLMRVTNTNRIQIQIRALISRTFPRDIYTKSIRLELFYMKSTRVFI